MEDVTQLRIQALDEATRVLRGLRNEMTGVGAEVEGQNRRMGASAAESRKGFRLLEEGLRATAFEATGVPGPMGRIAQSLLLFAGGSTFVLAVSAGIAVIGSAYQALTKDARESADAMQKAIDSAKYFAAGRAKTIFDTPVTSKQADIQDAMNAQRFARENAFRLNRQLSETQQVYHTAVGGEGAYTATEFTLRGAGRVEAQRQFDESVHHVDDAGLAIKTFNQELKELQFREFWAKLSETAARTAELTQIYRDLANAIQQENAAFESTFTSKRLTGPQMFDQSIAQGDQAAMLSLDNGFALDGRIQAVKAENVRNMPGILRGWRPPTAPTIHGDLFGRLHGDDFRNAAAGIGISSLSQIASGDIRGGIFSGGGSLAGLAIGGPVGASIGGILGGALGNVFGGLFGHKVDQQLEEAKRQTAILQRQLNIAEDEKNQRGIVVIKAAGFDPNDVEDLENLAMMIRNMNDLNVTIEK